MNLVYADFAAATPTEPAVAEVVARFSTGVFANPSSAHGFGAAAQLEMEEARRAIAGFIGAQPNEIFFTATGTESNNLAILGVAKANKSRGRHFITTAIEHPSILNACRALEKDGWQVTYLPVDKNGQISLTALEKAMSKETVLFSTHYGNSELGTLPDLAKIAAVCRKRGVLLHVDACQAMVYQPIDVAKMAIDLLTFNGSKMYGPKGVAVLYVRAGVAIFPLIYGGGQEQSLRSGTENLPGIVGLAEAVKIIQKQRATDSKKIGALRDWLQTYLEKTKLVTVNVKTATRLPNHLSVTFQGGKNTDYVAKLSKQGIGVSSGSACSSRSLGESHVLTAIGLSAQQAQATIRISLGRPTTKADCQKILQAILKI